MLLGDVGLGFLGTSGEVEYIVSGRPSLMALLPIRARGPPIGMSNWLTGRMLEFGPPGERGEEAVEKRDCGRLSLSVFMVVVLMNLGRGKVAMAEGSIG